MNAALLLFAFVVFMLLIRTRIPGRLAGKAALLPWKGFWRLVRGRR